MTAPTDGPEGDFRYLTAEDMRRVSSYEFAPKALVEGYFSGRHQSRRRGNSTEFRDYRPYAPGDDASQIDWRVFARNDRLYLRNHHQETSVNCHIFLDSSASMGFGREGWTKLDYASFFAAALSYLVVRGRDLVGLHVFDTSLRFSAPPGSTRVHLHRLLKALETNRPGGRTSLATSLRKAGGLLSTRGSVVILSDFLDDPGGIFSALDPLLHRGFRVYLFQILDPGELDLEDSGLASFRDLETGESVLAHTRDIRAAYRAAMDQHVETIRSLARRRQVHYQLTHTSRHYYELFDALVTRPR